jgi:surface protein
VSSLFLSVGHGAFRCGVLLNIYDISRFVGSQVSHVVVLVFGCGLKRDLVVVVVCVVGFGLSLFFVAPFSLLAVFSQASAFKQDVSTWNTGAVTNMRYSKCTLSLPLCWPRRLPLWCVVEYIRHLEVRWVTSLTRFCSCFLVVV